MIQNCNEIQHWLLPSTVCFSVPFLFTRLNKQITFYDYGYDANSILDRIENLHTGILLTDYYSKPWQSTDLLLLKASTPALVHDCCLSAPVTDVAHLVADLLLFSTGKGKVLDLGSGAIGFCHSGHDVKSDPVQDPEKIRQQYQELDAYWKEILVGKTSFKKERVQDVDWIEHSDLDEPVYLSEVHKKLQARLDHKSMLNATYSQLINPVFLDNSIGNEWRFNILVDQPRVLLNELVKKDLFASNHYANAAVYLNDPENTNNKSSYLEKHIVNLFNDQ
ncbi:MAG: hypothetical protein V4658_12380, partial [Bacteroidota bacterium]